MPLAAIFIYFFTPPFFLNFYLHICLPKKKGGREKTSARKEAQRRYPHIYIIKRNENSQRWWMMNNDWSHVASPWKTPPAPVHPSLIVIYGCWRFYVCLCQFRSREITYISFVSHKISRCLAHLGWQERKITEKVTETGQQKCGKNLWKIFTHQQEAKP